MLTGDRKGMDDAAALVLLPLVLVEARAVAEEHGDGERRLPGEPLVQRRLADLLQPSEPAGDAGPPAARS
jgi:hypothetical protein